MTEAAEDNLDPTDPAWTTAMQKALMAIGEHLISKERTAHQGYRYVGHADVVQATAIAKKHGIIVGAATATRLVATLELNKGHCWLWEVTIPVYEATSGHAEIFVIGATTQRNDKAAFVASTAADRTLRLRLFGLGGGDAEDPEHPVHDKGNMI